MGNGLTRKEQGQDQSGQFQGPEQMDKEVELKIKYWMCNKDTQPGFRILGPTTLVARGYEPI